MFATRKKVEIILKLFLVNAVFIPAVYASDYGKSTRLPWLILCCSKFKNIKWFRNYVVE